MNSIVESEAIYLECLSVSLQYMKAMKVKVMRLAKMMILYKIMMSLLSMVILQVKKMTQLQ